MADLFTKNEYGKYVSNTNDLQQSRFLPLIQQAELVIKRTITKYLLTMGSVYQLKKVIEAYIKDFSKNKLPKDIINRESYINGLFDMANKVYKVLNAQRKEFAVVIGILNLHLMENGYKAQKITNPKQLTEFIQNNPEKIKYDMWSQAKAAVRVQDYPKQLDKFIEQAGGIPTLAIERNDGKKPITVWQKAELDIRQANQHKMVDEAIESGHDLWYISSHPDCSKRCSFFQGELVSVTKHAPNPQKIVKKTDYSDLDKKSYRVEKVDGKWVYSLPDIRATKDKYGYNNMIIEGFNCRHYLIKYNGQNRPKDYDEKDIKRMRKIGLEIREMERKIRGMKIQEAMLKQSGNVKATKQLAVKIKKAIQELREFCDKNGFAFQEYRVK